MTNVIRSKTSNYETISSQAALKEVEGSTIRRSSLSPVGYDKTPTSAMLPNSFGRRYDLSLPVTVRRRDKEPVDNTYWSRQQTWLGVRASCQCTTWSRT